MQYGKPPQQTMRSNTETPTITQRRTVTARSVLPGRPYSICFSSSLAVGPKIICRIQIEIVHLHISEPTPCTSDTHSQTTPGPSHTQSFKPTPQSRFSVPPEQVLFKILPFACRIPPLKFGQIFTLFFYPGFREVMEREHFIALWGFRLLDRSDGRGHGQVRQDLQNETQARQNAPSLSLLLQPPPTTQPH